MILTGDLEQYLCDAGASLREAIQRLDASAHQFQIVVNDDKRLIGTLTDGDVRRAMLRGVSLEAGIGEAMNRSPVAGRAGAESENRDKLASIGLVEPFLPILDDKETVCEILLESALYQSELRALVMAGGSGKRLGERTRSVPKPLLPVGGKPILEHVLCRLENAEIRDITVSVHYLADQIKSYVRDRDNRARIGFVEEDRPLGTVGALGQIGEIGQSSILVVNGDIVTQVDFAVMHDFHIRHGYDGTIAVIRHETDIPFGVVRYGDDGLFESIEEKPVLSHFVAAGVYMLRPTFTGLVSQDGPMDMTELLNLGREVGLKIGLFPIHEYWIDVGRPDDLDRASRDHTKQYS